LRNLGKGDRGQGKGLSEAARVGSRE